MRKAITWGLAMLLLGVWSTACTTVVVKGEKGPEILLPGKFIESVDANTIRVECQGTGHDMNEAVLMARKGCVEWVATTMLAKTPGERQAYKSVQGQVFAQLDKYIGIPGPGSRDGKGKGIKSRVRISDDKIRVVMQEDVAKTTLQQDLVQMGAIQSTDEMLEAAGMPSLMAMPSKVNKGSKLRGIMEGLVNEYLTNAGYEVLDAKGVTDLNKMVDAIGEVAGAEEDEAAQVAMAAGADIYFVYEANRDKKGDGIAYSVNVKAYETTTGNLLASKNAQGPARANWVAGQESAALQEPLNDAMGGVLPIVTQYWKKNSPKGRKYFIKFKNSPKKTDMAMNRVLKKACSRVKMVSSTVGGDVVFRAQCKIDNLELASAIDDGIGAKMGGAEFDWAAKTRSALVVVFK